MFRPDLSNREHTISTLLAQLPRSRFPSPLPAEPRGLPAQRWERVAFGSRRPKERRKTKDRRSNRRHVPARRTKRLIAISSHPSGQLTPLCKFGAYSDSYWYGPFPIAPVIHFWGVAWSPQASRARRQPR